MSWLWVCLQLGRMRDEVVRLEGVVSQKEEELKDAEQYQVKLGTECFSLLDEVNESKRILVRLMMEEETETEELEQEEQNCLPGGVWPACLPLPSCVDSG